jgi:predicted nuclease of predicted toxin-antitoxin system
MRFLIDENLSEGLVEIIADLAPGSLHVRRLGLVGATDSKIWDLARLEDLVILTRDADFVRLSIARGSPPKVIHVRLGNCTTLEAAAVIRRRSTHLRMFTESAEGGFLVLS